MKSCSRLKFAKRSHICKLLHTITLNSRLENLVSLIPYAIFTLFFLAISVCSTAAELFSLLSFITHSRFDRFAKTLEKCTRQRLRPAKQPFFRKQICEFTLEEIYPFYIHLAHRIQTPIQKLRILIFEESNHNESFEIGCWIP